MKTFSRKPIYERCFSEEGGASTVLKRRFQTKSLVTDVLIFVLQFRSSRDYIQLLRELMKVSISNQ